MAGRQTRGRQRIPISRIQNQDDMYATFSKRRLGLYKKASELSTLCGVDIGVIIFSPTNVPYSFFHPTVDSVLNNQPQDANTRAVEASTRSRIDALNRRLDQIQAQKQHLEEMEKTGWWEETPLNMEQVKERIEWFQAFKAAVASRIQNGPSIMGIDANYNAAIPHDPISYANESAHLFLPQDPSFYNYVSPHQDPSINIPNSSFVSSHDGGSGLIPADPPLNPISGRYGYIHPHTWDPSTADHGHGGN